MKKNLIGISCLLLLAFELPAQSVTQASVEKAAEVISQAIEAYGGADKLNELNSISVQFETSNYAVNQSRKPGPPWDINKVKGSSHVDFEKQQFAGYIESNDDRNFHNATIVDGEQGFQVDHLAKTSTPIASPNFMNTAGPFIRVTPALLVKQVMQRSTASHYVGQVEVDGKPHDVVTLVMEVGPVISLFFDQETHLLNKSERYFAAFGLVGYRFYDYKKIDGIPFNQRFELYIDGENNMKRQNVSTQINAPVTAFTVVNDQYTVASPASPDPLSRQKIDAGVYLIGGNGTYAMFVEMDDYVIAIGGTAGLPERIASLREVLPNKPLKYGVLTHHHSDHILAAQVYAEEDATVIVAAAHEQVVSEAIEKTNYQLETVKEKREFKDENQKLKIIDVGPTDHSEHLLVAYLPEHGIVFQADHFGLRSPDNPIPANQATEDFAAALKKQKIRATKLLSAHSPLIANESDLEKSVEQGRLLSSSR